MLLCQCFPTNVWLFMFLSISPFLQFNIVSSSTSLSIFPPFCNFDCLNKVIPVFQLSLSHSFVPLSYIRLFGSAESLLCLIKVIFQHQLSNHSKSFFKKKCVVSYSSNLLVYELIEIDLNLYLKNWTMLYQKLVTIIHQW